VAVDNSIGGGVLSTQLTSGLPAGSQFPEGTTTVTWQANFGCDPVFQPICTLTCSFTVTVIREQPVTFYVDADGDGHGDPTNPDSIMQCHPASTPAGYSTDKTDCDDHDASVWRSATVYVDHDADGYDNGKQTTCYGNTWPSTPPFSANIFGTTVVPAPGYSLTTLGPDCNDEDKTVHAVVAYYRDADGDGYGDPNNPTTVCASAPPSGYVTNNTDCNDNDGTLNPTTQWVLDADKDGYYVGDIITQCTSPATDYVKMALILVTGIGSGGLVPNETPGDCDDHNPAVHATFSFYVDNDGDGFGTGSPTSGICAVDANTPPQGYSTNNTDCDDNDASLWHLTTLYIDKDHDGYDAGSKIACTGIIDPFELQLAGYSLSTKGPDCDDNNAAINPATVWYKDADNDGYSDGTTVTQCLRPTGYKLASELTATSGDCDDSNPVLKPTTIWYKDADNDGYSSGATLTQCVRPSSYKLASELTAASGDCNDNNPAINPAAVEVCGNKIDDNCNGVVDEQPCYVCQNATGFSTTNITATSAKFNWTDIPNPVQWQVEYKSTAPGSKWIDPPLLNGAARSLTISGLKANQTYQWHIGAMCGKSWTTYSATVGFKTVSSNTATVNYAQPLAEEDNSSVLQLYPNPNNGQFIIRLHTAGETSGDAKIQLIDVLGRVVQLENADLSSGRLQKTVTMSPALTRGIYLVRIVLKDKTYQAKMIYQK
jgi:hypothetical protein